MGLLGKRLNVVDTPMSKICVRFIISESRKYPSFSSEIQFQSYIKHYIKSVFHQNKTSKNVKGRNNLEKKNPKNVIKQFFLDKTSKILKCIY